jgi:hypothetical protein
MKAAAKFYGVDLDQADLNFKYDTEPGTAPAPNWRSRCSADLHQGLPSNDRRGAARQTRHMIV